MDPYLKFLHVAGVIIWVGGMFFAWMCLRPVAAANLETAARLTLWRDVFSRFFPWVWAAVVAILLTGIWTLMLVGMKHSPIYWHIMLLIGLLMATIFVYIFFLPYPELKAAVAAQNWPAGAKALGQIRQLIATNLVLGGATTAIAYLGRFLA